MSQAEQANGAKGCPAFDPIVQWQQGQLPPAQVDELMQHVETCPACQHTVEQLAAADSVCRHLRQEPPVTGEEERTEVAGIVERMRSLASNAAPATAERPETASQRVDFNFLGPPQTKGEIGRLGAYSIQRLLGQGGMGLVFEALDLQLQRPVALKVLRPEAEQKSGGRKRFLREARAAAALRHEHVVTIYQVGEASSIPFLAMELLQGQSLETRCRKGRPLSLVEIARIGREVAEGLAAAHQSGLTHRDVKPDNIFLEAKSNNCDTKALEIGKADFCVKLLDFGLARATAGDEQLTQLTQQGLIVGTLAYMAPEQASGAPVDARTDLFSLGCVLYRLASGRLPFQGKTPMEVLHALANVAPPPLRELNPVVPVSFSRLVASLLARRPEDRPASARAVARELAGIDQELTKRDEEKQKARKGGMAISSRHLLLAVAVAGVLALVAWGVTVLRLETAQGEIVIQTSDPSVSILFEQGKVQIHDRKSGKKYTLAVGPQKKPNGEYEFEVTDEAAGLTFSTSRFTLKRGESVPVQVSFRPKKPVVLAHRPVPADALQRKDIPDDLLIRAGGGDKAKAPPELVAVWGPRHFCLEGTYIHNLYTRFSPDGRLLVTISIKDVLVYDAATGRLLHRLIHDKGCGWFAFHPDNKVLAVSSEAAVDLWDLVTGKSLGRLTAGAPMTYGLSYTPDGKSLATTDADGKSRLWDVAGKKVVRTFEPPEGHHFIQAPEIHPKGGLVALHASGPKPVVHILDLNTGQMKAEMPGTGGVAGAPGLEYQASVKFSPDGRLLASVRNFQAVDLWEVATWKEAGVINDAASILNFSADSGTLFRGYVWNGSGAGGILVLLDDVKTRGRKSTLQLPVAGDLAWSDLSPDGRTIAVRPANGTCVTLFDAATGKERFPLIGHRGSVTSVAVSPDGRSLVSTGQDHRALLWDLTKMASQERERPENVRELVFVPTAFQKLTSAAFSPDGKWVAARSPSWIRVWKTTTGKELITLQPKAQDSQTTEFAFHSRDHSLITAAKNRLQKWTLPDGAMTTWEEGHDQPIETVDFHPAGQQVAAGDKGGAICLWDASTFKRLRRFQCAGPVLRVQFSADGEMIAATTAAPDGALYLFNLQTGAKTRRVGQANNVIALAWRGDGQALATTSDDGTVRIWPRDPDKEPRILRLPGKRKHVAFTPEGRHLLTANDDGSIYLLRLIPEQVRPKNGQ